MYTKQIWCHIFWLSSGEVLVFEYHGFKDDSLFNRKLAKRLEDWSHMSKSGSICNEVCQTILYILEACDIFGRQTMKE